MHCDTWKVMKWILGILLVSALLIVMVGVSGYLYLKPDKIPPRLPSADTSRLIESGELIGFEDQNGTHAWLGIPYAAPPVRQLRWKAPRPPKQWMGQHEALDVGGICPQGGASENDVRGEEDCLFLNIWAPNFPRDNVPEDDDRLPVMFWIHGGGNVTGSGGIAQCNGSVMAGRHSVIVVTINHRLGPLGWFAHQALRSEDASPEDNSGNFGTMDIIQALEWVQENIGAFGGDPGNVTIFGASAGGTNVLSIMASPLTKGLFHRAIVQSGSLTIIPLAVAENHTDDEPKGHQFSSKEIVDSLLVADGLAADQVSAKKLQASMGPREISAYLRGKSPGEIIAAYQSGSMGVMDRPNLFGDGYVLPKEKSTADIFSHTAGYNSVPVILGSNRDEMKPFMSFSDKFVKKFIGIPIGIRDTTLYETANRYASDRWKVAGVDSLASLMREVQGETVFAYRFDADDLRNFGCVDLRELFGAGHAMEVPYVFGNFPRITRILYPGSTVPARNRLSNSMMSYWAEFAYTGTPGRGRSHKETEWTAWQNGDKSSLRLLIMDTDLDQGTRMSSEWITMADIKKRYLAEENNPSQEDYCNGYKELFKGDDFVRSEYENLGIGGCT